MAPRLSLERFIPPCQSAPPGVAIGWWLSYPPRLPPLHGVYFPKVQGPHLVDQPLLPGQWVSAQKKICKPMRESAYSYWIVCVSLREHPALVFTVHPSIGEALCPSGL